MRLKPFMKKMRKDKRDIASTSVTIVTIWGKWERKTRVVFKLCLQAEMKKRIKWVCPQCFKAKMEKKDKVGESKMSLCQNEREDKVGAFTMTSSTVHCMLLKFSFVSSSQNGKKRTKWVYSRRSRLMSSPLAVRTQDLSSD